MILFGDLLLDASVRCQRRVVGAIAAEFCEMEHHKPGPAMGTVVRNGELASAWCGGRFDPATIDSSGV
jgi:hypothetical protein